MPDTPNVDPEVLGLLLELANIQAQLKPLHKRVDRLIAKRVPVLQSLRDHGLTPVVIHELSKVPLSTIYANTSRPDRDREGGREGDD
jgi:hypothetical protein